MQKFKTAIFATSLAALVGCSSGDKIIGDSFYEETGLTPQSEVCVEAWYGYWQPPCPPKPAVAAGPKELAAELDAAYRDIGNLQKRILYLDRQLADRDRQMADLNRQLDDRDREIAALRSSAGDSAKLASQLSSAQGDLARSQQRVGDLERELAASMALVAGLQAGAGDKDRLAADLAACNQRIAALERQLADRDKELADLRGELSTEMTKLKEAQRGLIRALRPQIESGDITVDLNDERLLINLASGYLFGSGEDQLKPAGANALKQVGAILKEYPEYKVAVDGHTDNRPIRGELKKKFPTNTELSEARAANAALAMGEAGLSGITTHGYADTRPVTPNTTDAGRAKNRRVEVRVTR